MNPEGSALKRKEKFLAQVRKAEEMAASAANEEVRKQWLKIAEGYRHLATINEKS